MTAQASNFCSLPPRGAKPDDTVIVVIETAKGSRNKLAYDGESGAFWLKHVLPAGSSFPYNFGFVPGTRSGDGDPLDVLVFLDESVSPGTVVPVRLIGVIEAVQQQQGVAEFENNRFLGVPTVARDTAHIRELADLRPGLLDELEAFFTQYNRLRGITFRIVSRGDAKRASALLDQGIAAAGPSCDSSSPETVADR